MAMAAETKAVATTMTTNRDNRDLIDQEPQSESSELPSDTAGTATEPDENWFGDKNASMLQSFMSRAEPES